MTSIAERAEATAALKQATSHHSAIKQSDNARAQMIAEQIRLATVALTNGQYNQAKHLALAAIQM